MEESTKMENYYAETVDYIFQRIKQVQGSNVSSPSLQIY